jgi:cytochrome oxidase assembly protein ShyY1
MRRSLGLDFPFPHQEPAGATFARVLRPRWLAGHFLVLVFAASFIALGFWQLGRHHEKQDKVAALRAAYAAPAPSIEPGTTAGARVEATGTFDPAYEFLLRNQTRGDDTGYDVLTPLRLADGTAVLVDRGFNASPQPAPPAAGTVIVRGLARPSRPLGADQAEPRGDRVSIPRVDLSYVGTELPYDLRDLWIEAQALEPAPTTGAPKLKDPPPPDQVNHMQYAIQWWLLALVPIVGWPIVLWRRGKRSSPNAQAAKEPDPEPPSSVPPHVAC